MEGLQRDKTKKIQQFIINHVDDNPTNIVNLAAEKFNISRQAAHKHVQKMVAQKTLAIKGNTRARSYTLKDFLDLGFAVELDGLSEDTVWREKVLPNLQDLPQNVLSICQYGFTEMLNNAIDHSQSKNCLVGINRNAKRLQIFIHDHGVGIFKKIRQEHHLENEEDAIFQLSKGKLTTDKKNHSGEGIFFTSKSCDQFLILSEKLGFAVDARKSQNGFLVNNLDIEIKGTCVKMEIAVEASRTLNDVFKHYEDDDSKFSKTIIVIQLARYGSEGLISRSQAKRVMSHAEQFREIILDFNGIDIIGQGFADEIFRVFKNNNPNIKLSPFQSKPAVENMIRHVQAES